MHLIRRRHHFIWIFLPAAAGQVLLCLLLNQGWHLRIWTLTPLTTLTTPTTPSTSSTPTSSKLILLSAFLPRLVFVKQSFTCFRASWIDFFRETKISATYFSLNDQPLNRAAFVFLDHAMYTAVYCIVVICTPHKLPAHIYCKAGRNSGNQIQP